MCLSSLEALTQHTGSRMHDAVRNIRNEILYLTAKITSLTRSHGSQRQAAYKTYSNGDGAEK